MSVLLKEIDINKFYFINDRHDLRVLLHSYDLNYIKTKIDDYITSVLRESDINMFHSLPNILVSKSNYGYIVLDRPLDVAIAKVVANPLLIYNFTELYEYLIAKTKPYTEVTPAFFHDIRVKVSKNNFDIRYLNVADFAKLPDEEVLSIINRPDFVSLIKRCFSHNFQNPIKVHFDSDQKLYVCEQNKHFLLAYQLLSNSIDYPGEVPDTIAIDLQKAKFDPFFKKIRVDDHYSHPFVVQTIPADSIHFNSQTDILYNYIYRDPQTFKQLMSNIVTYGLNPFDVNCYFKDDAFFAPFVGVYPILAMQLLSQYRLIENVFPEMLEDVVTYVNNNKYDFKNLNFSYNFFEDEYITNLGYRKIVGILSLPQVQIEEEDLNIVENVQDIENPASETEEEKPKSSLPTVESSINTLEETKPHKLSVTETIEVNLDISNDVLDERLRAPIKYGNTVLKLDEIEAFDFKSLLEKGLSPRYKNEVMDYLTLKKEFPTLRAEPSEEGLYRISSIDNWLLLARVIAVCPQLVKDIDQKFYNQLMTAKQFYDVKKAVKAEVKVPEEEKIKKGNIFHHLTDGKLNRSLLKKKVTEVTLEEMVEISVIRDKDILERFNPVKDPIIFYRTIRSFLECLFHLYYIHLDENNIYHDNGKWTDKFKPLSAWITMFKYIQKKEDIADKVFPKEVWQAFKDSMRMDVVFILNEVTHMSLSAERYYDECRDFLWKNSSLEKVIVYILQNIR